MAVAVQFSVARALNTRAHLVRMNVKFYRQELLDHVDVGLCVVGEAGGGDD